MCCVTDWNLQEVSRATRTLLIGTAQKANVMDQVHASPAKLCNDMVVSTIVVNNCVTNRRSAEPPGFTQNINV